MDTGGCAAAAPHGVVDPAAATRVAAKKRPHMADGWTGTKKNKSSPSREHQVHGLESGGSGEASSTAVVTSRKRSYDEYSELDDLDAASYPEKMFKCNYWEDPAYAKRLEYFGLTLARSAAHDNSCDRLARAYDAWMAGTAASPTSD